MSDCIFCQIANHQKQDYTIYEDSSFIAFLDIIPYGDGHTLVIPKTHYRWVWDMPNVGEYFEVTKKVALHLKKIYQVDAIYSFVIGEKVPHPHIHLVPALPEFTARYGQMLSLLRQPKIDNSSALAMQQKLKLP